MRYLEALRRIVMETGAQGRSAGVPPAYYLALAVASALAIAAGAWSWHAYALRARDSAIRGEWGWDDSSIFEFQKIDFRFTADSFFLAQRFVDPAKPKKMMPCSQTDHQIHAAGRYFLTGDTLRFKGDFTDPAFSRDTIRLCRDFGFRGSSHFDLRKDTLCLQAPGSGKGVCLTRMKSKG